MPNLPPDMVALLAPFANIFARRKSFSKMQILMMGALLAKGGVTVCACLRAVGLASTRQFSRFHRLLNRDRLDMLLGAKLLLFMLVNRFCVDGILSFSCDDTLERRRGRKIKARGWFRDAVLSTPQQVVTSQGLRWMPVMLLVSVPLVKRIMALPFMTILVPAEREQQRINRRHVTPQRRATQIACLLRRWFRRKAIRLVGDTGYACKTLARRCMQLNISLITRLRVGSRFFEAAPPRTGKRGRPKSKGVRLPAPADIAKTLSWTRQTILGYGGLDQECETAQFDCVWAPMTGGLPIPVRICFLRDPGDPAKPPFHIVVMGPAISAATALELYIARWGQEVVHRDVREHLGMETQRQWSDQAIARTTPMIFALYSLTVVMASQIHDHSPVQPAQASWYPKHDVTFADCLRAVRGKLRRHLFLHTWSMDRIMQKIPFSDELLSAFLRLDEAA